MSLTPEMMPAHELRAALDATDAAREQAEADVIFWRKASALHKEALSQACGLLRDALPLMRTSDGAAQEDIRAFLIRHDPKG